MSGKFSVHDYWRMFAKRGIRLPLSYFLNAHLFDLIHKTDTHAWVPKESYSTRPPNFDDGVLYMTSWTSEVKRVYRFLLRRQLLPEDYVFLDLGCGKGKVCLLWKRLEPKNSGSGTSIIGLDYYEPLIETARENHRKMYNSEGSFFVSDVTSFDFEHFQKPLIVYAYNPFGADTMASVASRLVPGTLFIYSNPVHSKIFRRSEFETVFQHSGWHPTAQTTIFRKISLESKAP